LELAGKLLDPAGLGVEPQRAVHAVFQGDLRGFALLRTRPTEPAEPGEYSLGGLATVAGAELGVLAVEGTEGDIGGQAAGHFPGDMLDGKETGPHPGGSVAVGRAERGVHGMSEHRRPVPRSSP
jgi:hypothetical protein